MEHKVKIAWQNETGMYEVSDHFADEKTTKILNEDQLEKLIALMEDTQFIIIQWAAPILTNDRSLIDRMGSELSTDTLREIAAEQPLSENAKNDILKSLNN